MQQRASEFVAGGSSELLALCGISSSSRTTGTCVDPSSMSDTVGWGEDADSVGKDAAADPDGSLAISDTVIRGGPVDSVGQTLMELMM